MGKGRTVALILLGVVVLGVVAAVLFSRFTDMDKATIAMATLALCSAVADTLAIVLYLRGGRK